MPLLSPTRRAICGATILSVLKRVYVLMARAANRMKLRWLLGETRVVGLGNTASVSLYT